MPTEKPKHRLTAEERRRGQAGGAATRRERRQEERELLAEARRDKLDDAIVQLAELARRAADTIGALLDAESETVRLRSAIAVLEILDAAELREMSDRLERLEQLAAGANGKP